MTRIGKYDIGPELGQGPLGKVYVAVHVDTGQKVVFRGFIKPADADPEEWDACIARYHDELLLAQKLHHPNIATVYDHGQLENVYWVASEYFEGTTMIQLIDREGPQPIHEVLKIIEQVAAALDYAAENEVIHTDVTPYNVLLLEDGQVKVINFGLAHIRNKWGSPYCAPEVLRGEPFDPRSDVFGFGALTYELLVGDPPFLGIDDDAVAAAVFAEDPRPMGEDIDEAVHDVVFRMLAKDPDERYPTAGAALEALRGALEDEPVPPPKSKPETKRPVGFHNRPSLSKYNLQESDVRSAIEQLRSKILQRERR